MQKASIAYYFNVFNWIDATQNTSVFLDRVQKWVSIYSNFCYFSEMTHHKFKQNG